MVASRDTLPRAPTGRFWLIPRDWWRRAAVAVTSGALALACLDPPTASPIADPTPDPCHTNPSSFDVLLVPSCLAAEGIIPPSEAQRSIQLLSRAEHVRDSLQADGTYADYPNASEITRALSHIVSFFTARLFNDSVRLNRMLDNLSVTVHYAQRDSLQFSNGFIYPRTTPALAWQYYPEQGFFFQPVSTVNPQYLVGLIPDSNGRFDSLVEMTDELYSYAIWRTYAGVRFPVWEDEFPFNSGGIVNNPPWVSALSQGLAMMEFTERYRRTGDPAWKDRAFEVFRSFHVTWDHGGILLPDTSQGYWWEEFNPTVRIWNGSVWSALAVGYLWQATGDGEAKRAFDRGIEAIKAHTSEYDTGYWTLYSHVQGYNTVGYHLICVTLMDRLYEMTGDPWFKALADKWRAYTPPPGVT